MLTGIIALESLSRHALCSVVFGIISAAVLFLLGLPKTFHKMAILAYVDFASIILAVLVTVIVCAIESHNKPGGWAATRWYAFLPANDRASFVDCTISITNLAMSYAYAQCLPSFMAELRRPQDYRKAVWSLGGFQIVFYSLTGSLIYFFKGQSVEAPALLSLEPTMQKVVFGIAIPVIFISGSINSQTASRFIYHHIFPLRSPHHYISTRLGKVVWIGLSFAVTTIGEFSCFRSFCPANRLEVNLRSSLDRSRSDPLLSNVLGSRCRPVRRLLHLHHPRPTLHQSPSLHFPSHKESLATSLGNDGKRLHLCLWPLSLLCR